MPLIKTSDNCYKWGENGHIYCGKDAKKKAIRQGVAIEGPDKFATIASEEEYNEAIGDRELNFGIRITIAQVRKQTET